MWEVIRYCRLNVAVAPREGRVSRNPAFPEGSGTGRVAPREGRVSRNIDDACPVSAPAGAPREGRVSRNTTGIKIVCISASRAPRGACE